MVFLFVFLTIILIILTMIIILLKSKQIVVIKELQIKYHKELYINDNYEIILKLIIFNKIPICILNLNKSKIEKMMIKIKKLKNKENKIKLLKKKVSDNKVNKKILKEISNIRIDKLDFKFKMGTENAFITSMIIPIISLIIAIILRNKINNCKKQNYKIEPIFSNQNILEILISGIFEIKMIHIINIIYILIKKEGVKKDERTSNRRSYDYSYE